MHIDLHGPDDWPMDRFDMDEMIRHLRECGANAAGFAAVCSYGNAYYPTRIGHRHPRLRGDPLGDFLEKAHKNDIKVYGYINAVLNWHVGKENPDWTMVDAAGAPIVVHRIPPVPGLFVCPSSPYPEKYFHPVLEEVARGYAIDGMFLDRGSIATLGQGYLCYCPYCRKAFKSLFGDDLPESDGESLWREFVAWRQQAVSDFLFAARDVVRKVRPDAAVIFNGGYDALLEPTATRDRLPDLMHFDCGTHPLVLGLRARYWSGFSVPYMVHITRWHSSWQNWGTVKSAESLKQESAVLLAGGGIPSLADHPYPDGSLSPEFYRRAKEVFAFVKEREEVCVGTESVPHIAVLRSAATYQAALARAPDSGGLASTVRVGLIEGDAERVFHHVDTLQGAHKALAQAGLHFDLANESFLLPRLAEYRVVVLPNQAALDANMVAALEDYVRSGGAVVATAMSTLIDPSGQSLGDFALAEVLGVRYAGVSPYSGGFMDLRDPEISAGMPDLPVGIKKTFCKVRPAGARELAGFVNPIGVPSREHFYHSGIPAGSDSGHPAITVNRFGEGLAVYVAAPVFAEYWNTNYPYLRRLIKNLITVAAGGRLPIVLDAPPCVEVTVRESGGRTFVHLVNNGEESRVSGPRAVENVVPVSGISFRLETEKKPKQVVVVPGGEEPNWTWDETGVQVQIEELKIHVIVVVD